MKLSDTLVDHGTSIVLTSRLVLRRPEASDAQAMVGC
jgi:hypothetical protein